MNSSPAGCASASVRGLRRFGSPSALLLALLLFPLPWVEIQCVGNKKPRPATPAAKAKLPAWAERVFLGQEETTTLCSQSGLQAAFGTYSGGPKDDKNDQNEFSLDVDALMTRSTLLFVLPGVLLLGVVVGFLCEPVPRRELLLGLCAVLSLTILLVPLVRGFPLERAFAEAVAREALRNHEDPSADSGLRVKYTFWLMLTVFAVCGALALSAASLFARGRSDKPSIGLIPSLPRHPEPPASTA